MVSKGNALRQALEEPKDNAAPDERRAHETIRVRALAVMGLGYSAHRFGAHRTIIGMSLNLCVPSAALVRVPFTV